jgi:hypothetical protein
VFSPSVNPQSRIEQPPEVFISYARRDLASLEELQTQLVALKVSFWVDHNDIEGGQFFPSEISKAIKQSRLVILLCSEAAQRSPNVRQELMLSWKYQRPCLPLLLERINFNDQFEYFLEGIQWIEILDSPISEWMPEVARALKTIGVGMASSVPDLHDADTVPPLTTRPNLESLRRLARFNDSIWPFLAETHRAERDIGELPSKRRVYRIGSELGIAINVDRSGHLLLLDEGTEGKTYCLCPSWFASDTRVDTGLNYLPQFHARHPFFEVSGKPGREELLAIITDEPFPHDLMPPEAGSPARVLNAQDVESILAHLHSLNPTNWTALATYFDIAR